MFYFNMQLFAGNKSFTFHIKFVQRNVFEEILIFWSPVNHKFK